jgi:hypothetical protein
VPAALIVCGMFSPGWRHTMRSEIAEKAPASAWAATREHAKSWGASKFLNAKLRAFGKETALWRSWFGG